MKYIFIKKFETGEEAVSIIEDPIELFKSGTYKEANGDKLYQLGSEVKLEMSIKVKSELVHRGPQADVFRTKHPLGIKTDEGYNG